MSTLQDESGPASSETLPERYGTFGMLPASAHATWRRPPQIEQGDIRIKLKDDHRGYRLSLLENVATLGIIDSKHSAATLRNLVSG